MAVLAYPVADTPPVTVVAPFRRPRVRDNGEGDPLLRYETTHDLVRVTVTHRRITEAQLTTLQAWLDAVTDADTITIAAIDGKTYEGRFADRLYSVQEDGGVLRRATIQLVGKPQ